MDFYTDYAIPSGKYYETFDDIMVKCIETKDGMTVWAKKGNKEKSFNLLVDTEKELFGLVFSLRNADDKI